MRVLSFRFEMETLTEIQKYTEPLGLSALHESRGRTGWGKLRNPNDRFSSVLWVWKEPNSGMWYFAPCEDAERGMGPYLNELDAVKALYELVWP